MSSTEPPGALDKETSVRLRDQLQQITEEAGRYLGPEHRAIAALVQAARELAAATLPKSGQYAEYTPDE
ncbi:MULTISPECIES: hypothetical protein [Nocardia]|jgi:predicted DNA-binding protein (UPF0251 family)|uniref:hypothetical protein n=1 Tax=Nocardia TaxID=1817 RepID=UPI001915E995|nr:MULTISPECIES: hypothetical protein [Nocardia]